MRVISDLSSFPAMQGRRREVKPTSRCRGRLEKCVAVFVEDDDHFGHESHLSVVCLRVQELHWNSKDEDMENFTGNFIEIHRNSKFKSAQIL